MIFEKIMVQEAIFRINTHLHPQITIAEKIDLLHYLNKGRIDISIFLIVRSLLHLSKMPLYPIQKRAKSLVFTWKKICCQAHMIFPSS